MTQEFRLLLLSLAPTEFQPHLEATDSQLLIAKGQFLQLVVIPEEEVEEAMLEQQALEEAEEEAIAAKVRFFKEHANPLNDYDSKALLNR